MTVSSPVLNVRDLCSVILQYKTPKRRKSKVIFYCFAACPLESRIKTNNDKPEASKRDRRGENRMLLNFFFVFRSFPGFLKEGTAVLSEQLSGALKVAFIGPRYVVKGLRVII